MKRLLFLLSFAMISSAKPTASESQFLKIAKDIKYKEIAWAILKDAKDIASSALKVLPTQNKIVDFVTSPTSIISFALGAAALSGYGMIKNIIAANEEWEESLTLEEKKIRELKYLENEISMFVDAVTQMRYNEVDRGVMYKKLQARVNAFECSHISDDIKNAFYQLRDYFMYDSQPNVKSSSFLKALTNISIARRYRQESLPCRPMSFAQKEYQTKSLFYLALCATSLTGAYVAYGY